MSEDKTTPTDTPSLGPGGSSEKDAFNAHLIALLSVYERGPYADARVPVPQPRYDGPASSQTERILRSLDNIVKRMWIAEERVNSAGGGGQFVHGKEKESAEAQDVHSESIRSGATPRGDIAVHDTHGFDAEGELGSRESRPSSVTDELKLLKAQMQEVARVCNAVARGDLTQRVTTTVPVHDESTDLKASVNSMVVHLNTLADQVTRVSLEVGAEGILGGQACVPGAQGSWAALTDGVNTMAMSLTNQVRSVAQVVKAVTDGDLTKKITVDARGETLEVTELVNGMTESLRAFAEDVTRVSREVGTEGILGGQPRVVNVGGAWKDVSDTVSVMASNFTFHVRSIAVVTTAVARGDLTMKLDTTSASGEMLSLVNTVNDMIDQLALFAAHFKKSLDLREVGGEDGRGLQAGVCVQGIWQEIIDHLGRM